MSVLWLHVPQIYLGWAGGRHPMLMKLDMINCNLYTAFFMVTFFIISGYFMNVKRSFKQTILKDIYTLLFSAVILSLISCLFYSIWRDGFSKFAIYSNLSYWTETSLMYWFLFALFWSKQLTQLIVRYVHNISFQIFLVILICAFGILLKSQTITWRNVFNYQEALTFVPFVYLGYKSRQHEWLTKPRLIWLSAGYTVSIVILWICKKPIAGFNLHAIEIDYMPMALWLGISGSAAVIYVSMLLENSKVLRYIGTLTLPIFCFIFFFIEFFISLLQPLLDVRHGAIWFVLSVFVCSLACCVGVSSLLKTRYLKWTLGDFSAFTKKTK